MFSNLNLDVTIFLRIAIELQNEKFYGNSTPEGRSVLIKIPVFPIHRVM